MSQSVEYWCKEAAVAWHANKAAKERAVWDTSPEAQQELKRTEELVKSAEAHLYDARKAQEKK